MSELIAKAHTRRTPAVRQLRFLSALLALGLGVPACAQHGGGGGHAGGSAGGGAHAGGFSGGGAHAGGFSGGAGVHGGYPGSGSPFRGGFGQGAPMRGGAPFTGRPGYGPSSQIRSLNGNYLGSRGIPRGLTAARPAFYNRSTGSYSLNRGGGRGYGYRGGGRHFGYGYGYPGLYSSNLFYNPFFFDPFFGLGDPFYDDGGTFWDTGSVNSPGTSAGYGDGSPYGSGAGFDNGAVPQQGAISQPYASERVPAYGPDSEPGPWALPSGGSQSVAPARQEETVTIVFKDGRPAQQIRNYALTRSALLVTDARMREIPLDEIDLPATQRVNRAAGVDFRLPQSP